MPLEAPHFSKTTHCITSIQYLHDLNAFPTLPWSWNDGGWTPIPRTAHFMNALTQINRMLRTIVLRWRIAGEVSPSLSRLVESVLERGEEETTHPGEEQWFHFSTFPAIYSLQQTIVIVAVWGGLFVAVQRSQRVVLASTKHLRRKPFQSSRCLLQSCMHISKTSRHATKVTHSASFSIFWGGLIWQAQKFNTIRQNPPRREKNEVRHKHKVIRDCPRLKVLSNNVKLTSSFTKIWLFQS